MLERHILKEVLINSIESTLLHPMAKNKFAALYLTYDCPITYTRIPWNCQGRDYLSK